MPITLDGENLAKRFNEAFKYRNGELYWKINTNKSKNLVGKKAGCKSSGSYGTELMLCQRYLPVWYGGADQIITMYNSDTGILGTFKTPVPVRSTITGLTFSTNANSIFSAYDGFKGGYTPTNAALNNGGINYVTIQCNSTSLGTGRAGLLRVADSQWMYGTGCEL